MKADRAARWGVIAAPWLGGVSGALLGGPFLGLWPAVGLGMGVTAAGLTAVYRAFRHERVSVLQLVKSRVLSDDKKRELLNALVDKKVALLKKGEPTLTVVAEDEEQF